MNSNHKIAIIGLGYVGLPLAVEFAKKYKTVGFDIKKDRIDELKKGSDSTLEVSNQDLQSVLNSPSDSNGFIVTNEVNKLVDCNIYIITVPTPTDKNNNPVITPLIKASETVASVLSKNDIVIYESTVYPGLTEEECIPVLENKSGLKFNTDFFVGYSPERINPGDKEHTVSKILKVTSGSTPEAAETIDQLYKTVITAGTYKASSIKVAEAAKVIENSQRDINIAFVNELAKIFSKLNIDTTEVLKAAGTKWNFLPFKPGLVGGHCIGVDPYYLAQKAQEAGYHPQIILAGRRTNDGMGNWIASQVVKLMIHKGHPVKKSKVLCLGITFKENCPDIRNTKVVDVIHELEDYGCEVNICDPWANPEEVNHEYNLISEQHLGCVENQKYDAIILAVAHNEFLSLKLDEIKRKNNSIIYDVKSVLPIDVIDGRL